MTDVVLNLGGGVQSTTLLLMAHRGEIQPLPTLAIFADTGAEPAATYTHLDFLRREVGERIEIVTVTAGSLRQDIEDLAAGKRTRLSNPPVFARRPEDGRPGPAIRACTRDYKVRPIERELRRRGYGPKNPVIQWIGISLDEVERMKPSTTKWSTTAWPLIEQRMTRHDCLLWLERAGYYQPPKSACTFCPYHSDAAWRDLRDNTPDEWVDAVAVDRMIRTSLPGLNGEAFLHRQLVPLDEVDLRTREDHGQEVLDLDGAGECGGGCFT